MTDIVKRLRSSCSCNFPDTPCGAEDECRAAFDAADEIERLRAALWDIHATCNNGPFVWAKRIKTIARAALEGK